MSANDELPNWRGGHQAGSVQLEESPKPRGRGVLFALLGLLALIGMGAVGYLIAESQADSDTTTTADPAAPSTGEELTDEPADDESATTDGTETVGDEGDGDPTTDDASDDTNGTDADSDASETSDGTDKTDETDDEAAAAEVSERTAVLKGGKLYLSGKVPSQEVADFIVERAGAVMGPENVISEYEIDPAVVIPPGDSAPLYVEDVVLFQFNSIEIDPPFIPLLDLGVLLLRQNPQATLTVVTRTDAVGSEEVNLEVARKRADAVINYWLSKGVNADQLKADPRGEELASDDDDEQAAALNRRAEFVITGLLD